MADLQQAVQALRNAHNAGDVEAATRLAGIVRKIQSAPQQPRDGRSSRLEELLASQAQYDPTSRDSTLGEEFMRTLRSTLSSGRTGIASLLGDEEAQARAGLERAEAIGQDYGAAPSFEQVKETYGEEGLLAAIAEGARQVPRFVSQQLPTLAQAVAGAKAGAVLTPGPPQAKALGALAGGVGAFLPTFAGSNIERLAQEQQEAGEDVDVDVGRAYATALAQSGLQGVGTAAVLGKNIVRKLLGVTEKAPKEALEQSLRTLADRGVLQNIGRRGVVGAAGEIPTEVAQQILERNYAGLPLADEEAMAEYGEAAYASLLVGGTLGGVTGVSDSAINRSNLAAFEASKLTAAIPIVGANNTNLGNVRVVRLSDNEVIREDFDVNGERVGNTKRYMGEEGERVLRDFKKLEEEGGSINENVLNTQYKAVEEVKPAEPAKTEEQGEPGGVPRDQIDAALKEFDDRTGGMPDVPAKPVKPLTAKQLAIQAEIEAEAAKQGVTLTPEELRRTALFADKKNNADRPGAIAARVGKIGKPITPAAGTETTPPPTSTTDRVDQQRDERIQQEGTPPTGTPPTKAAVDTTVTPTETAVDPEAAVDTTVTPTETVIDTTPDKTSAQKALESTDLGRVYDALYDAERNQNVDPAFVQQLKNRANELYAQKYPGLTAKEQAELDTLYKEHAQIKEREGFTKQQQKELRSKVMDRIADLEQKQVAPASEVSERMQAKRVASVRRESILTMKEDKETTNREMNKTRRSVAFRPLAKYLTENANDLDVALRVLAYDLVAFDPTGLKPKEIREIGKRVYKDAVKAQAWVNGTLSKPANRALEAQIAEFKDMQNKGTLRTEKIDSAIEKNKENQQAEQETLDEYTNQAIDDVKNPTLRQLKANPVDFIQDTVEDAAVTQAEVKAETQSLLDEMGLGPKYYELDAAAASSIPMTETQVGIAERGDLSGVLQNIEDTNDNKDVRQLAKALKANIGETKLEVVDGLTNEFGKQIAGLFDPKTNTIKLNSRVLLSPHTVMHEAAHAATSHTLDNKSHLVTKALTKLFNDVKSQLDTEYGAKSLDEFVAEAFSNVEFRQKLASIMVSAGDGKQITAFQRFKNAVGNLLRTLMGKSTISIDRKEDALTQADALIRSILSPAPAARNGPEIYAMAAAGGKEAETLMNVIMAPFKGASTTINPQDIARVKAVLAPISRKKVEAYIFLLPLNAQIELAANIIPSAKELFPLLQRKKAARDNEVQKVNDLSAVLNRVFKGQPAARQVYNDITAYSTLAKADPSLTEADAKKKYGKDKERLDAYYDMRKNYWSKLNNDQKKAYQEHRDYYADQYQKIRNLIEKRLDEFVMDADKKDKLKVLLLKDVLSKESIEPYFPLARSGKFWLEYEAVSPFTDTVEHYKEAFDSETDRDLAREEQRNNTTRIKQLEARGLSGESLEVKAYERSQNESKTDKVPTGFAYRILNEIRAINAPKEIENLITEMLLNAMPENSLARMFKPRAGTMGFKTDAITVLKERSNSIITQITNLEYDGPLSKLQARMQEEVKTSDDKHKEVWMKSFEQYIDYSRSPFIAPWSRRLKGLGFLYTLGFNVSSVLVNMTNPAVVTYPYLGGEFGFDKALKAMAKAHNIYMGAGGKKTGIPYITKRRSAYDFKYMDKLNEESKEGAVDTEFLSAPNLSNIDFSDLSKVPKEYRHYAALEEALRTRGQSNRSMLTEVNEFAKDNFAAKVINLSGLMFHQGERWNRNISAIAAYDLKLEALLKGRPVSSATAAEMDAATDYAINVTELTNSGSMAETAPRISQGPVGSVIFMYKRFGISMLYLQFRMLRQAMKAGKLNAEERKIARRQIAGLFLTSGIFAGVRGMPMMGILIAALNRTREDDEEDADTMLRNLVGEGPFNGLLNHILGVDIAPRIAMTDLMFRALPNQEATSPADRAFNMLGPLAGITNRVYRGFDLMKDGEIWRGTEAALPASLSNAMKAYRYAGEGATTLRGDPITEDIGMGHVAGQVFGFAPAGYTRQLERNALDKRVDRRISETRTRLLRRYYQALRENDFNTMFDLTEDMREFSLKHPEVAITADTIKSSVRQHKVTDEMARQLGGITVSRRRFATVMQERMDAGF